MIILKSVTLSLAPTTFVVTGDTKEEMLANAKKAFIEQVSKNLFPHISYSINDADALTLETSFPGLIVETEDGLKGIVTAVKRKTIDVMLAGHLDANDEPQAFKKSNATFEEARSIRCESSKLNWEEGDSGYLKTGEGFKPVVIGKTNTKKTTLHIIGANKSVTLTPIELMLYLKDNKE
ncbi:hypothetical protein P9135_29080 [Bacillus thuringiensis]|uniref:hypothetical protein n=1 Tax=Bacillus thuringiensis TaxID=1428 RepID=UPI001E458AA4|nr:hypothetical protein [Bacillus thuringiensis]MEC3515755.1 hypothetical protein [Bacillus thuringiensis]MEC3543928.1 hypothetical protein [Bacillus thuringiensis]